MLRKSVLLLVAALMPSSTIVAQDLRSGDAEAARESYEKILEILGDYLENLSYQEAKGFVSDAE